MSLGDGKIQRFIYAGQSDPQELEIAAGSGVTITPSVSGRRLTLTVAASGGGGGTLDHAALTSNLAWTSSGHTGTASKVAGFSGAGAAAYYTIGSDLQAWDADLDALAALSSTAGMLSRTGAGAFAVRTLTAPAAGLTISNPTGAAGSPTFALADDLSALEALSGTGWAKRTGTSTWSVSATVPWTDIASTPTTLSGYGITDAVTYAPEYAASAAPSGYQWASLGRRLELAPATSSFPSLNLLTAAIPGTTKRNSSLWTSATCSGGTLAAVVKTASTDYSSAGHGCATILDRTAVNGGRSFLYTMHVSGSVTATNTNGVGIGFWDAITNARTCRIAVYYVGSAVKVYYGYGTTESSTAITAGNLTTGVWLQIEVDSSGTLYLRYQVAALASLPPTGSWTTPYTVADFVHTASGARWPTWNYSVHGYNSTGADRTLPTIDGLWDSQGSGANPLRTPADGAGIGVSSASPAVTLFTDVPYTAATCDQTALRAWAAKVAAPASALETASVEFLVRSAASPGGYSGSTWYAASAIVAPSSSTYLEVQARVVSDGITLGSLDVGAVSALRVK